MIYSMYDEMKANNKKGGGEKRYARAKPPCRDFPPTANADNWGKNHNNNEGSRYY